MMIGTGHDLPVWMTGTVRLLGKEGRTGVDLGETAGSTGSHPPGLHSTSMQRTTCTIYLRSYRTDSLRVSESPNPTRLLEISGPP